MVPPVTALARRLFRFALDRRRDLRRALRPFRRQFLLSSPLVIAITWPWYKFRFRFSRVRFLRQLQFFLRDHLGGGQRAVVSRHNLLLGGWNGMSGFDFAMRSAKHLDPSTRLEDSFYDELLTSYNTDGGAALSEETIRSSGYFQRISLAARMSGHYRGVNDDEGLVQVTREYLDRYRGEPIKYRPGRSRPGTLPRVRRISGSEYFSVLDGHHRLAMAMHRGAKELEVVVAPGSTTTYLQKLLLEMSWLDGSRRIYQPVEFPEVQSWPLMRKCGDRLDMMTAYLDRVGMTAGAGLSYLDVGSCYGWFVAEMGKRGFDAKGIEMDKLALELGPLVYGISGDRVTSGDCVALLKDQARTADVVSCFSVLHHFVMGRGTSSAPELMALLAERTRKVLFLDTGQAHESWFRWTLPEWTTGVHRAVDLEALGFHSRRSDRRRRGRFWPLSREVRADPFRVYEVIEAVAADELVEPGWSSEPGPGSAAPFRSLSQRTRTFGATHTLRLWRGGDLWYVTAATVVNVANFAFFGLVGHLLRPSSSVR